MGFTECKISGKKMAVILFVMVALMAVFMGMKTEVKAVDPHVDIRTLKYKVKNDTVIITDCLEDAAEILEIPATIIESSTFESCGLKSVIIHVGIMALGQNAFYTCEQLSSVHICSSDKSIYMNAFAKCAALQEVVIPNNVTFMGGGVFADCTALKKATVSGELKKIEYKNSYLLPIVSNFFCVSGIFYSPKNLLLIIISIQNKH